MDPLTLALISAVPSVIEGISAISARKKYSDAIGNIKLSMPKGVSEAESLLSNMALNGLPGYETKKNDILSSVPQTLESLKEVAGNPAMIIGGLNDAQSGVTNALSNLAVKDALAKIENNKTLADFLGGTKAAYDMEMQKYKNDVLLGQAKEGMLGVKDMLAGFNKGVSTGISTFGNASMVDSYKGMFNSFEDFMSGGETGVSSVGSPTYTGNTSKAKKDFIDALMMQLPGLKF